MPGIGIGTRGMKVGGGVSLNAYEAIDADSRLLVAWSGTRNIISSYAGAYTDEPGVGNPVGALYDQSSNAEVANMFAWSSNPNATLNADGSLEFTSLGQAVQWSAIYPATGLVSVFIRLQNDAVSKFVLITTSSVSTDCVIAQNNASAVVNGMTVADVKINGVQISPYTRQGLYLGTAADCIVTIEDMDLSTVSLTTLQFSENDLNWDFDGSLYEMIAVLNCTPSEQAAIEADMATLL